jgi:deferrochelatase/peroxidase EfeB
MSGLPWRAPPPPVQLAGVSDLTVLTPMRQGLIPGVWDTVTWAERFERVLRLLDSLRRLSREAGTAESPFFDLVGRWQIVHFFRFAAVPAERQGGGPPQILLNVTFDGVWEPYMRVIWGPIGPLLDLIFSHAETYRLAHTHGFDDYMAWVRRNELRPGFFYADGGLQVGDRTLTVHDRSWLAQADTLRRGDGDPVAIDRAIAQRQLLAPPPKRRLLSMADELANPTTAPPRRAELSSQLRIALSTGLRVLRAFALMRPTFDAVAGSTVLLRATQALLEEFHDFVAAGGFERAPWSELARAHAEALAWFGQAREQPQRPARMPALADPRAEVQAGVLSPHPGSHGLMLLARVRTDADALRAWRTRLAAAAANFDHLLPGHGDVTWTLGVTPQGLLAHGLPAAELDKRFPLDFRQGMEARAPAMGDLGSNHPQQWQLPLRNWVPADGKDAARIDAGASLRIALGEVQLVIVLRANLGRDEEAPAPGQPLPRLSAAASALEVHGLQILSAQALSKQEEGTGDDRRSVGHFGFVDPKSQPQPGAGTPPGAQWWSDDVPWGEVLLGHANPHRLDEAWPHKQDELLDNGSFLVVRKLRQFVGRWNTAAGSSDADRELLMGRRRNGSALLPTGAGGDNDFRYDEVKGADGATLYAGDPDGRRCPFASHVRRANPRTDPPPGTPTAPGEARVPRILRRGISYGPSWAQQPHDGADRGLMFMALNARIADQFETVQRWLSGGNASGVPSDHDDPVCGIARPGAGDRHASWVDANGEVQRRRLGTAPFVELQWGLYLFVPARDGLKALALLGAAGRAAEASLNLPPADAPLHTWKELLETGPEPRRRAVWREVRARGGVVNAGHYGVLVGAAERVLEVLRDDGSRFSVQGYGERMERSLGLGYLGQDRPDHDLLAPAVNAAIAGVPLATAFALGRGAGTQVLAGMIAAAQVDPSLRGQVPVDLLGLVEAAVAGACARLFGLPDGIGMAAFPGYRPEPAPPSPQPMPLPQARCPLHQLQIARYVFLPHAEPVVERLGQVAGRAVLQAGQDAVVRWRTGAAPAAPPALAKAIGAIVDAKLAGQPEDKRNDLWARTLVGVLQGLPATTIGHTTKLLLAWSELGPLWDLQRELLALAPERRKDAGSVLALLRPALMQQMRPDPVPDLIWRRTTRRLELGGVHIEAGQTVVLSLRSAAADEDAALDDEARHALLFGRAPAGTAEALHGCPGMALAEGLMAGLLLALAEAGSWQRSALSTLLWLRPTAAMLEAARAAAAADAPAPPAGSDATPSAPAAAG